MGLSSQVGATAGIETKTREAVAILRELDAIISPLLAAGAATLATWKSSVHIEKDLERSTREPEIPPGSGSVALAFSGQEGGCAA